MMQMKFSIILLLWSWLGSPCALVLSSNRSIDLNTNCNQIFSEINKFREVKKLPKLIYSYDLMKKSSKEAKKMARVGRFLHPDIRSGTKNIYARVERFKQQMVNETQGILFAFIEIK